MKEFIFRPRSQPQPSTGLHILRDTHLLEADEIEPQGMLDGELNGPRRTQGHAQLLLPCLLFVPLIPRTTGVLTNKCEVEYMNDFVDCSVTLKKLEGAERERGEQP